VTIRSISPTGKIENGSTEKTVHFDIDFDRGYWKGSYGLTDSGGQFDDQIDKLQAHGDIAIEVREFQGEPTHEWKEEVVRQALKMADETTSSD